jgi:hypothetical protein
MEMIIKNMKVNKYTKLPIIEDYFPLFMVKKLIYLDVQPIIHKAYQNLTIENKKEMKVE